jgi:hypothetical protein
MGSLICMGLGPSPFGACRSPFGQVNLASVGRFSMTTRTDAPSLSLSIATCSPCDAVWLDADAFLPLLPTFDSQSLTAGQRSPPSTWGAGVDVFTVSVYHLTCIDTQLSKSWRSEGRGCLRSPDPCRSSLISHLSDGFERTGRTTGWSRLG